MEWIYLVQDKDHWCTVLNMLIKILFPKGGKFFDLLLTISFSRIIILWIRGFELLIIVGRISY
jgi:hypothetical protein